MWLQTPPVGHPPAVPLVWRLRCRAWAGKSRLDGREDTGGQMVSGAHVLCGRGWCFKALFLSLILLQDRI